MLAPVLARLQAILGVVEARVDCSGTYFLITGEEGGALERAVPALRDVLGSSAHPVEGAARDAQLSRWTRGELWFSADDIRALSYVEGRILSTRMADAVAAAVQLDGVALDRVQEAVRAEIMAALDHAHDTGGRASSGWFWEEWPRIVERVSSRLTGMPDAQRAAAFEALLQQAPGGVKR